MSTPKAKSSSSSAKSAGKPAAKGSVVERPAVGDPAPDFTLPIAGGGSIALSTLKGHTVVLYFYPKDDTPGCTQQAISFSEKEDAFTAAGAVVIGVSRDSVAKHDAFAKKHALTITLASDEDGAACQAYGVWKEKSLYGRAFMGIERSTFVIGPDGRIAAVWRKVKVPGHCTVVLQAAEAAGTA